MAEDEAERDIAVSAEEVLAALRDDPGRTGFQQALGRDHTVSYISRGPRLLVSFETLERAGRGTDTGLPVGLDFVEDKNWSLLHFGARCDSWFRAQTIYDFIDDLVDNSFFEDFDRVMFFGAGIGAYAACAYSVAAPGATVIAISPQATLDTERAGWDLRFPGARRLRFDTRYGYAPDMLEGANAAFILFDPRRPMDHVHASLFQGPNVTRLRCRHLNGQIEPALAEMDLLHRTIEMAAGGGLTGERFYALLRARREHDRYLRALIAALAKRGRPLHVALACRHAMRQKDAAPFFGKKLKAVKAALARENKLPAWLAGDDGGDGKAVF